MEQTMEYIPQESMPGKYDVYLNSNGKKYIVLEGLDPKDIHTPGALETWAHTHYAQLELAYWIIFFATFAYLIVNYLVLPLYAKFRAR